MRKITHQEIREAARIMTECFFDYPLYQSFFPEEAKRKRGMFYFCWYYIYVRHGFSYFSQDKGSLLCVQKPGDRFTNPLFLILNPFFLIGALSSIPISSLLRLPSYSALVTRENAALYQPEQDWYVHVICVRRQARGSSFFNVLHEMDEGEPLYCYTHTARNVRLYEMIGFQTLREIQWHDVPVYIMRRERK